MQAITTSNIRTLMQPSYHLYRKPYRGTVEDMNRNVVNHVTVYVHKDDLFDALEKHGKTDYVEVKVMSPELISLYGDGPPKVIRQTWESMYDGPCVWGRFAGGSRK